LRYDTTTLNCEEPRNWTERHDYSKAARLVEVGQRALGGAFR